MPWLLRHLPFVAYILISVLKLQCECSIFLHGFTAQEKAVPWFLQSQDIHRRNLSPDRSLVQLPCRSHPATLAESLADLLTVIKTLKEHGLSNDVIEQEVQLALSLVQRDQSRDSREPGSFSRFASHVSDLQRSEPQPGETSTEENSPFPHRVSRFDKQQVLRREEQHLPIYRASPILPDLQLVPETDEVQLRRAYERLRYDRPTTSATRSTPYIVESERRIDATQPVVQQHQQQQEPQEHESRKFKLDNFLQGFVEYVIQKAAVDRSPPPVEPVTGRNQSVHSVPSSFQPGPEEEVPQSSRLVFDGGRGGEDTEESVPRVTPPETLTRDQGTSLRDRINHLLAEVPEPEVQPGRITPPGGANSQNEARSREGAAARLEHLLAVIEESEPADEDEEDEEDEEDAATQRQPNSPRQLSPFRGVNIEVELTPEQTFAQEVALSPGLSVYTALIQAAQTVDYDDTNPFDVTIHPDVQRQCYVIESISGIESNGVSRWRIDVTDAERQVLYSGQCLVPSSKLPLRAGYSILVSHTHT